MIKIAIDMMGGDNGTAATKEAVRRFLKDHKDVELFVCGKKEELSDLENVTLIEANEIIKMEAGVMEVLRKKDSSMVKAIKAVQEHECQAVVSSGSTGAFLSAATLILKKIPGVMRPALCAQFPSIKNGGYVSVLDIGASNENTADEIAQFGFMGTLYSEAVNNVSNPRVGLLSNGSEEGKGSPEGKEAYDLLSRDKRINFIGNVEGDMVINSDVDVLVTDGFSGNVCMKSMEGAAKGMSSLLKKGFRKSLFTQIGYLFSRSVIKELKARMNAKKVGGAMLLGVNAVAVKAHGNSDAEAFYHAILLAYKLAKANICEEIKKGFGE